MLGVMADVTHILSAIEAGDPKAAAELLPLVYDELRRLAAARLADERPGQTLQPTALVHEAYLRLVQGNEDQPWAGRAHAVPLPAPGQVPAATAGTRSVRARSATFSTTAPTGSTTRTPHPGCSTDPEP